MQWSHAPWDGGVHDPDKEAPPSCGLSCRIVLGEWYERMREDASEKLGSCVPPFRVTWGHWNWQGSIGQLLTFQRNYVLYRFQVAERHWPKISIFFPIQSLLTHLDLGNFALAQETIMMEVPGREKVWYLQPFGYNTRTDGLRPTANTAPCAITHSVARYIRRITKKNKPTLVINTHNTLNLRLSLTNTSIRTTSVNVHVHKLVTS